jgi:hypothetical protein
MNTTVELTEGLSGYLLNGLVSGESENGKETVEHWIAILTRLADEQDRRSRVTRDFSSRNHTDEAARENRPALEKVAAGPYRSLGGYFDYSQWADRERFLELDRAIAAGQDLRDEDAGVGMVSLTSSSGNGCC